MYYSVSYKTVEYSDDIKAILCFLCCYKTKVL